MYTYPIAVSEGLRTEWSNKVILMEPKRWGRSQIRTSHLGTGQPMSTNNYKALTKPSYILAAMFIALLAGCASSKYGDAKYIMDSREELRNLSCRSNQTPACIERIGQPTSCFCSSRDALERLLENPSYQDR